jgi:hypothetical protein
VLLPLPGGPGAVQAQPEGVRAGRGGDEHQRVQFGQAAEARAVLRRRPDDHAGPQGEHLLRPRRVRPGGPVDDEQVGRLGAERARQGRGERPGADQADLAARLVGELFQERFEFALGVGTPVLNDPYAHGDSTPLL